MRLSSKEFLNGLLDLPVVYDAKRSPDGKHIALNILNIYSNLDVFLVGIDDKSKLDTLTKTIETTVFYDWWPDSKSILVGEDRGGNERVTLFRVYLEEPLKLYPLTKASPDFYLRSPTISPDGKILYYFANYDFKKSKETEISHLFSHSLSDEEINLLISPEKPAYNEGFLNLDGTRILYCRSDITPGGIQWWVINTDGTDNQEILNFGPESKVEASWLPDSDQIVFITDTFNDVKLKNRLTGIYSVQKQTIKWINKLGESIGPELSSHDFSGAFVSRYDPSTLILSEEIKARKQVYFFNLKTQSIIKFPKISGTIVPIQKLENGRWLSQYYGSTQPTTYVSISIENISTISSEDFTLLFNNFSFSKVRKHNLIQAEDFNWISRDGKAVHGWLYKSAFPNNKAIVFVHGGPTYHSSDELNVEIQYYVSQGFNVLDPNYRGSTGYGTEFRDSIKKEGWGMAEQFDIATGAHAMIERGFATENKIGITGTSYGGYSAWCCIAHFSSIFRASAPVCGMTDLIVDYETTRPDLKPYSAEMMGGTPEEVPERYQQASPINFLNNIKGKVLIVQGLKDPNVTPENVRVVENKLKIYGINYEKLEFDDEGHGIIRKRNKHKKILTIATFFEKSLI
ncbi:MAG: prolyl oligopeptidase family serine peptidase [Candidatus Hodarchaeota archaeon]